MNWYKEDGSYNGYYIGDLVRVSYCKQYPFMNGAEGTIVDWDESGDGTPLIRILLEKDSMSDEHIFFMESQNLFLDYPYATEELELVMGDFEND